MLDDHGKYSIGRRKRIEQEDLRTHHGKTLIKAFKETNDKILLEGERLMQMSPIGRTGLNL